MGNVFSLTQPCDYMVRRASRHRMAGRYDEAMTLLARAKDEYGVRAEIEQEMALVYEEIGCDEDAARCWRRIVILGGEPKVTALFELAILSLRNADITRAQAYFEQYAAIGNTKISPEAVSQVYEQIEHEVNRPAAVTKRGRAKELERRAAQCLQAGRIFAAKRALTHAIRLWPTAQGFTLLACTMLLAGDPQEAVVCAETAHELSPGRVQAICVLADALAAAGEVEKALKMLHIAALRAKTPDDLYGVAMESAKRGEDALTLHLTAALLRMEPYHTHAMMMRACALANTGRTKQARRLFGRLCRLLPENTVCEALYRQLSDGAPLERLSLGIDVPKQEAAARVAEMVAALYDGPAEAAKDRARERRLCRICAWAMRSPAVMEQAASLSLLVLSAMNTEGARCAMTDALMDPNVADGIKMGILQMLTAKEGIQPFSADIGGKPVRLLAGGTVPGQASASQQQAGTQVVQRASDALASRFPDAPQTMLSIFIRYLRVYGAPKGDLANACVTALKYAYYKTNKIPVALAVLAREDGVSKRLCRLCLRRFARAGKIISEKQEENTEEQDHEMH